MRRVFDLDVLECPRCGGRMSVIATIEAADVLRKILGHLGLPTDPPPPRAGRPPPLPSSRISAPTIPPAGPLPRGPGPGVPGPPTTSVSQGRARPSQLENCLDGRFVRLVYEAPERDVGIRKRAASAGEVRGPRV